jgi:diadenosine tetraphosphate (Ap4A) HIT family hydrolase
MSPDEAVNQTMLKFGYPDSRVAEYAHWVVLLRPQQVTLGALVLACKGPATALAALPVEAFAELRQVVADVEATLKGRFAYDKINYLMLMMVDPNVHFHVVPRYSAERDFAGVRFADRAWPKPPDLAQSTQLEEGQRLQLLRSLRQDWPPAPTRPGQSLPASPPSP